MTCIYIDIETLPIQDPQKANEYVAAAKPPANYKKPETIDNWRKTNGAEILSKTSFDGGAGQICCIGWDYKGEKGCLANQDERHLIETFFSTVSEYIGPHMPVVVGHNVAGFDLPFIRKRCMVHGIRLPKWFPQDIKPWGKDVFDTMHQWDSKNFISMDRLAGIFGIEGKTGVDGSMVAQMWADGKHQEIVDYCAHDVQVTKQIHEHMMRAL